MQGFSVQRKRRPNCAGSALRFERLQLNQMVDDERQSWGEQS
jgi:hypothetical protein